MDWKYGRFVKYASEHELSENQYSRRRKGDLKLDSGFRDPLPCMISNRFKLFKKHAAARTVAVIGAYYSGLASLAPFTAALSSPVSRRRILSPWCKFSLDSHDLSSKEIKPDTPSVLVCM